VGEALGLGVGLCGRYVGASVGSAVGALVGDAEGSGVGEATVVNVSSQDPVDVAMLVMYICVLVTART